MSNYYTTCNRKSRHKSHAIGTRFRDLYNNGSIHTTECGNYRIVFNRFNPRSSCASNVPARNVLGELCGDELRMAKALHKHHQEHIAQPKVEPAELHQPQLEPAVQQPAQKKMSTGKKIAIGVGAALGVGLGWLVWKKTR